MPHHDGHTLSLTIESGYFIWAWNCPHEGASFPIEDAPPCRSWQTEDGHRAVSGSCIPKDWWDDLRDEAFKVETPIEVTSLPLPVEWWWEGEDEFFVRPMTAEAVSGS